MRLAFLRHALLEGGPALVVDASFGLLVGPKDPFGLALSLALCDEALLEVRAAAASLAAERGLLLLAELLRVREVALASPALRVPDFGAGRPLTLGERKSLARRRDRGVIARVLRDPDPSVVEILLGNPSLVEADVVQLASRRPIDPSALVEIIRAPRWAVRYRVRLAAIQNPACPLDVALLLLPHVTTPDLAALEAAPDLRPAILEVARQLGAGGTLH